MNSIYGIKVEHPSDWIETGNTTFGNYKRDDFASVDFLSPISTSQLVSAITTCQQ
jgi:hypothetical protein